MGLRHWRNVLWGHPRPVRLAAARFLEWTGLSPLLTIKFDDYRLRFYPTNVTANLWINRDARVHGLALFRDYCKPGDVVIDVGANVGEVSIILSKRAGPTGQVFAFEPNLRIFNYLLGNLRLNECRNVTPVNAAVGASAGTVRMSDDRFDDMNRIVDEGAIEVACTTLDAQVLPDRIALLKIDVEGSELRVLQGAQQTLRRTACVNCEMGEAHYRRYGYGMRDLIGFLRQAGFNTFVVAGSSQLRAVDERFNDAGGHELVAVKNMNDFLSRTGWTTA